MNPEPTSGIKTWQWVVTVIVIIVLIVIGVMVFGNKGSQAPATTETTPAPTSQTGAVNRIIMADQYPGNVVYLSSVQLQNGGWVVIKSDNAGQPGDTIGETYSASGINPVKITLTKPMVDGGTYYAILYTGNNTATFSSTAEQSLTDPTGAVIMHVFHASASADQSLKG